MSLADPIIPTGFDEVLRPFRRRSVLMTSSRALLWVTLSIGVLLLLAMWIDLVWALPAPVRWWVSRIGPLVFFIIASGWTLHHFLGTSSDRLARQIDAAKRTGGEIHTGWQLATQPIEPSGVMSAGFAAIAVERARRLAGSVSASEVFPSDTIRRPVVALLMSCVVTLILTVVMPGIARNQIMRFLAPNADIPPYTGIFVEVELDQNVVLYGANVIARVRTSGGAADRMNLVTQTDEGIENLLPMLPADSSFDGGSQWQVLLSNVTEPLTLYGRSGASRSRLHRLDVQMTPQISPPKIRVTPPAYVRGGTYLGPIPGNGIEGLVGTKVEWFVSSNRPLSHGTLRLQYHDGNVELITLNPQIRDDTVATETIATDAVDEDHSLTSVAGSMILSKPGRFAISVTDVDEIDSHQSVEGSISLLQDQRPIVRIVSPRPISLATPNITLPVVIEGSDDYGITSLTLFRSLNGSPARKMDLDIDGSNRQSAKTALPLLRYGVTTGDEIQLFARIEDNDPAGAKGAESPVTTIHIVSMQEFQEMMLQRRGAESLQAKYATSQRYLENLAEALRELEETAAESAENPSKEATEKLQQKLAEAQRAANEAASAIETLAQQAMPIDVDQALSKRLAEQAKEMQAIADQLAKIAADREKEESSMTDAQREGLKRMSDSVAKNRDQLEKQAVEPMQRMQEIFPLLVDQQRFAQIAAQQRDLEMRIQSLQSLGEQGEATQRRIADLESEQEQLRQSLDRLLDDVQSHLESLPDDSELDQLHQTAQEFVDGVRGSDAMKRMSSAQQNLLNEQMKNAHDDAQTAAEILESFLSQCNAMGDKACENCKLAFNPKSGGANLGNSLQQILEMMGMKPGTSGMRPGGRPGMGLGWGAGGGYSQRSPGPENVGMYGAIPTPTQSPSSGNGEQSSGGIASVRVGSPGSNRSSNARTTATGAVSGQSDQTVPGKYRAKVSSYFEQLAEQLGESQ